VAHLTDAAVPEFDFHFATVYLLDDGPDDTPVVRMAAGASPSEAIASTVVAGGRPVPVRVPRWALEQERALAPDDVVAFVARSWQVVLVGPATRGPSAANGDLFAGALPEAARWLQVPVIRDGAVVLAVPACLIGEPENGGAPAVEGPPFTLAGEIFRWRSRWRPLGCTRTPAATPSSWS